MHGKQHAAADAQGLVLTDQRALHHVVALTMGIEADFLGASILAHEGVVALENVRRIGARLQQVKGEALGFQHEGEFVLHFLRRATEHPGAADLAIKAAGAGILDEHAELVALADGAILQMRGLHDRGRTHRAGRCHVPALLAAKRCACLAGDLDDLHVAQARPQRPGHRFGRGILQRGHAPDEGDLFRTLHGLDRVDQGRRIDEGGTGEMALEMIHHGVGNGRGTEQPDARAIEFGQSLEGAFRVIGAGEMHRGVTRRAEMPADAAPQEIITRLDLEILTEWSLADGGHGLVARKHHRERIAVGGGHVGQIFHVAADKIVVGLRQQHIDFLFLHRSPDQGPAPFKLLRRDRRIDAFGHSRNPSLNTSRWRPFAVTGAGPCRQDHPRRLGQTNIRVTIPAECRFR